MSDSLFGDDDAANTPLTAEERDQLLPSYIALRRELNEAEQINIGRALRWLSTLRRDILDQDFMKELHHRMFGEVWRWAGKYRTTPRNIGIDAFRIPTELQLVIDDTRYWVEHHTYSADEIAVRFSHRVVKIHPFPNGNGRFSRLIGDLLASRLGQLPFTWGSASLVDANVTRNQYVGALKSADAGHIVPLLDFARS